MTSQAYHIAELPTDLQVLLFDFVYGWLGLAGIERMIAHRFAVRWVALRAFPRVRMWTDYRDRGYSEAMINSQLPPVLICGERWLDGRNRVWAARQGGKTVVGCIDLSEIGLRVRSGGLGKLKMDRTVVVSR